jgi:hypothetical protein
MGAQPYVCLRNCASMGAMFAVCVSGEWACPNGVFHTDCPPDSCHNDDGTCCHPTTGNLSMAACGADEKRLPCEGGAVHVENDAACIPETLNVTDCRDLEGTRCETVDVECHNAGGCRFSCRCIAGADGSFWGCIEPVC